MWPKELLNVHDAPVMILALNQGKQQDGQEIISKSATMSPNVGVSTTAKEPSLRCENVENWGRRNPCAAALASVVAQSQCLSDTSVARAFARDQKLARAKVRKYLRGKKVAEGI